jgi:hypothetical protein
VELFGSVAYNKQIKMWNSAGNDMYVNEHERLSNGIEKISGIEKKN